MQERVTLILGRSLKLYECAFASPCFEGFYRWNGEEVVQVCICQVDVGLEI